MSVNMNKSSANDFLVLFKNHLLTYTEQTATGDFAVLGASGKKKC